MKKILVGLALLTLASTAMAQHWQHHWHHHHYRHHGYIHGGGKVGAIVKLGCETDYVAKNEKFEKLGNEVAMQVAAMAPENVEQLLEQAYIRESGKTISELVKEAISTIGENITISEISRLSV